MMFVGLGNCTHEFIGLVDRLPYPGTTAEFRQFSSQGSGSTANAMTCLARWGEGSRFVGKVGDDLRGYQIIHALEGEGIDASLVVRQPNAVSQLMWVLAEPNCRDLRGFSMEGTVSPLKLSEVDLEKILDGADYLLIDGRFPEVSLPLVKAAKSKGIGVTFYLDDINDANIAVLALVDHIVTSERVAGRFVRYSRLELICDEILRHGGNRVTITLGSEGVVGKEKGGDYIEVPVVDVDFVDALGANGAYFAATAYAEAHNYSFDYVLRFANTAAALLCTDFGPRTYIPTLEAISARCSEE